MQACQQEVKHIRYEADLATAALEATSERRLAEQREEAAKQLAQAAQDRAALEALRQEQVCRHTRIQLEC